MTVHVAERRRSVRTTAAYPVSICDRRGRVLSRGRTANISENGVFVLVGNSRALPLSGQVFLQITVPDASGRQFRRDASRTVRYACRIVRSQSLGRFVGMGIEFVRKLA